MTDSMSPTVARNLKFAGAATAVLGVGFAAAAVWAPDLLDRLYRLAGPAAEPGMNSAARFGAGIYGGLMAGWGVSLHLIGRRAPITRAVGWGLLTWWAVDSAASVATGYPLNALSNTGFLALFTPALVAMARRAPAPARAAG